MTDLSINTAHHGQSLVDPDALLDHAQQELQADRLEIGGFSTEAAALQTGAMVTSFLKSYEKHKDLVPLDHWLTQELQQHVLSWSHPGEAREIALEVIESTEVANRLHGSLQTHLEKGNSGSSWLARRLEESAATQGNVELTAYAARIDRALAEASNDALSTILRKDGGISQAYNLDGFIAEQHHASTFNIDAAAQGSSYRAKVLTPETGNGGFGKNSMDIGIYDKDGKLVRRYQSKYGQDAESTGALFEKGDYRGQRKLVPQGHGDEVHNSSETISIDGVSSRPLSKEEAKQLQERAQREQEARQYEWSDANRLTVAKQIGKQALISAGFVAGLQGIRIFGRRIWNGLNGQENPALTEDLQEFLSSSAKGATQVGVQVAVSGALVVAVKNGWLKVGKNTPAGVIANMAHLGLENAKCLYRFAKGELSGPEAVDAMGQVTTSGVVSLLAATKGAAEGAAFGACFGPVGIAAGGLIGGIVGGLAGNAAGEAIYEAGKRIVRAGAKVVADTAAAVCEGVSRVANKALDKLKFW